jgi:hypothetical protein
MGERKKAGSSNLVLLNFSLGRKSDFECIGNAVDGPDVAKAYVMSLDSTTDGNPKAKLFVVHLSMDWDDATTIAKKHWPSQFKEWYALGRQQVVND